MLSCCASCSGREGALVLKHAVLKGARPPPHLDALHAINPCRDLQRCALPRLAYNIGVPSISAVVLQCRRVACRGDSRRNDGWRQGRAEAGQRHSKGGSAGHQAPSMSIKAVSLCDHPLLSASGRGRPTPRQACTLLCVPCRCFACWIGSLTFSGQCPRSFGWHRGTCPHPQPCEITKPC